MSMAQIHGGDQAKRVPTVAVRLVIPNILGLHARPASLLVRTAQAYAADITIEHAGQCVNAKSVIGVLTLGAGQGAEVMVTASGVDAREAIDAIKDLFVRMFAEVEGGACSRPGWAVPPRSAAVVAGVS